MRNQYFLLLIILITVLACKEEELPPVFPNENLLFTSSLPLPIELAIDTLGLPNFDVNAVENAIFCIAISEEKLVADDIEIQNQDAIIWTWHNSGENNTSIKLTDGVFSDSTVFSSNDIICQLQSYNQLYWAAWAWNPDGTAISHATPSQGIFFNNRPATLFNLEKISVTDTDGDTYIKAGEVITYKITLNYQGNFPLNNLVATLSASNIVELPLTVRVNSTTSGKVDLSYVFSLPNDAIFKDTIPLSLDLAFNDCFDQQLNLGVATTGRDVCLKSMTLKKIYSNPPPGQDAWDDICGIIPYFGIFRNPDPCYTLSSESIPNIYSNCPSETSGELEDVDPTCPDAQWPAFVPCVPLVLNEFYTVRVLDENPPACEDNESIGQIGFYPRYFLDSTLTFQTVNSTTIQIMLELAWE